MPRLRIDKAFAKRIKTLWEGDGKLRPSFIRNPIESFRAFKKNAKFAGSKHATLDALSQSWRTRVMNGPELNILFLGMPFLLDFAEDWAMGKIQEKETKAVDGRAAADPQAEYQMKNLKRQPVPQASHQVKNGSARMPRSAPYSDKTVPFHCQLLNAGMSEDGALSVSEGEYESSDAADRLSEKDQRILLEVLFQYAPDQVAALTAALEKNQ